MTKLSPAVGGRRLMMAVDWRLMVVIGRRLMMVVGRRSAVGG